MLVERIACVLCGCTICNSKAYDGQDIKVGCLGGRKDSGIEPGGGDSEGRCGEMDIEYQSTQVTSHVA